MRIALWAISLGTALALAGCADRFRPAAPEHAPAILAAQGARDRLVVSALPPDLDWLSEGLRLYREIGRSANPSDDSAPRPAADWMSVLPSSPLPATATPPRMRTGATVAGL